MTDFTTNTFEDKKKKIELSLAKTLLDAYEDKKIDYKAMQKASIFILDNLYTSDTDEKLNLFMKRIAFKWNVFRNIEILSKEDMQKQKEQEVIEKLSGYFKNINK